MSDDRLWLVFYCAEISEGSGRRTPILRVVKGGDRPTSAPPRRLLATCAELETGEDGILQLVERSRPSLDEDGWSVFVGERSERKFDALAPNARKNAGTFHALLAFALSHSGRAFEYSKVLPRVRFWRTAEGEDSPRRMFSKAMADFDEPSRRDGAASILRKGNGGKGFAFCDGVEIVILPETELDSIREWALPGPIQKSGAPPVEIGVAESETAEDLAKGEAAPGEPETCAACAGDEVVITNLAVENIAPGQPVESPIGSEGSMASVPVEIASRPSNTAIAFAGMSLRPDAGEQLSGIGVASVADSGASDAEPAGPSHHRTRSPLATGIVAGAALLAVATGAVLWTRLHSHPPSPAERIEYYSHWDGPRSWIPMRAPPERPARLGVAVDGAGRTVAVIRGDERILATDDDWLWIRYLPLPVVADQRIDLMRVVRVEVRESVEGRDVLVDINADGKPDYQGRIGSNGGAIVGEGPLGRRLVSVGKPDRDWFGGVAVDGNDVHWLLAKVGALRTRDAGGWYRADWQGWLRADLRMNTEAGWVPGPEDVPFDHTVEIVDATVKGSTLRLRFRWQDQCELAIHGGIAEGRCKLPLATGTREHPPMQAALRIAFTGKPEPRHLEGEIRMEWPDEEMLPASAKQHPAGPLRLRLCADFGELSDHVYQGLLER